MRNAQGALPQGTAAWGCCKHAPRKKYDLDSSSYLQRSRHLRDSAQGCLDSAGRDVLGFRVHSPATSPVDLVHSNSPVTPAPPPLKHIPPCALLIYSCTQCVALPACACNLAYPLTAALFFPSGTGACLRKEQFLSGLHDPDVRVPHRPPHTSPPMDHHLSTQHRQARHDAPFYFAYARKHFGVSRLWRWAKPLGLPSPDIAAGSLFKYKSVWAIIFRLLRGQPTTRRRNMTKH